MFSLLTTPAPYLTTGAFALAQGMSEILACSRQDISQDISQLFTMTGNSSISQEEHHESEKIREVLKHYPAEKPKFDRIVKSAFPGAISNKELELKVVEILAERDFHDDNTLLATSLCCDELARRLEDDLGRVYGNNFTLGGLAGFPFAGITGFGAMVSHVPDNGFCLIVHGPHVGITKDGLVGKVERRNLALVDNCCGSAIAAANYVRGITDGGATITGNIQSFLDFQQSAVQEMILPHGKRLHDAGDDFLKEIPYALYQSQDVLLHDIVKQVRNGLKHYRGTAILGGVQINTGPDTMDYFHPLRFELMDNNGNIIEDMLPHLTGEKSENEDDVWASVRNVKISE